MCIRDSLSTERRRRDLNPRAAINDLLPFQGSPFSQLGYFSICLNFFYIIYARRGWDSNPRALADKRFSRPPRYDHFDTSPKVCLNILLHRGRLVNRKSSLFLRNSFKRISPPPLFTRAKSILALNSNSVNGKSKKFFIKRKSFSPGCSPQKRAAPKAAPQAF